MTARKYARIFARSISPHQVSENHTGRIAFGLLLHALCLALVYAVIACLMAAALTGVSSPLLPYHQLAAFGRALLPLAIESALLGGGLYAIASLNAASRLTDERLLNSAYRLWTAVCVGTTAAGLLGIIERASPLLDMATLIVLALTLYAAARSAPRSALFDVWAAGVGLIGAGIVLGLVSPASPYAASSLWSLIADRLRYPVGALVSAVPLVFWLMHRVSNITPGWMAMGIYVCGGLLALVGTGAVWASLGFALDLLGVALPPAFSGVGYFAAGLIVFGTTIMAAHLYRALSDRSPTHTLAAHWLALFGIAFLLGGILHAVTAWPGVWPLIAGTQLDGLGDGLWALALIALAFGLIDQIAAELRGQNVRVTGLAPFWLVLFGGLGSALALLLIGVVQVYLWRGVGVPYLQSERLLTPLYGLWQIGVGTMAGGLAGFALAVWARSPLRRKTPVQSIFPGGQERVTDG